MDSSQQPPSSPIPPLEPVAAAPSGATQPIPTTTSVESTIIPPVVTQTTPITTGDNPKPTNSHRKALILSGLLLAMIMVAGTIAYLLLIPKKGEEMESKKTQVQQTAKEKSKADEFYEKAGAKSPAFAKTSVAIWDTTGVLMSQGAATAKTYTFAQPSKTMFQSIASSILPTANLSIEENAERFVAHPNSAEGDMMLYMQKAQGYFLFKVIGEGPVLPATASDERSNVLAYMQKMYGDSAINITATYQKSHVEGVTYYEAHRSWSAMGLPVLNTLGLFNLPNNTTLNSLTDAPSAALIGGLMPDVNIVKTSDGADGKVRQNEFNTVTFGIKNGQIVSILSNMRLLDTSKSAVDGKVLSNNEALDRLAKNQYQDLFISPAGAGVVDEKKFTPNNQAKLTSAKVIEGRLVYLEDVGTNQKQLAPYYLFRGTGTLDSGYDVKFLATVAANNAPVLGISTSLAQAQGQQTQQQGTLEFPTETNVGTTSPQSQPPQKTNPTTTKPTNRPSFTPCYDNDGDDWPNREQLSNLRSDGAGNEYGQFLGELGSNKGETLWYVILKTKTLAALENAIDYAAANLGVAQRGTAQADEYQKQDKGKDRVIRTMGEIQKDFDATQGSCPIRLTGTSPTIFVYSDTQALLDLSVNTSLTYAQPTQVNNAWSVQTGKKLTVNGRKASYIYYEYEPISWTQPAFGWNIHRSKLTKLSHEISRSLGLTQIEQMRLTYELRHAAMDVDAKELFVGLIPQSEVDANLPLQTNVAVDNVYRYHFYISPASDLTEPVTPTLSILPRPGTTILELGATPGQ